MSEQECIDFIFHSNPDDPRLKKWEYKIILDTLQDLDGSDVKKLLDTINTVHKKNHKCDNDLFSYNGLYGIVGTLTQNNILIVKNKIYYVSTEYVTSKVRYMPVSNYCVGIFLFSVLFMLYSLYTKSNIQISVIFVMIGAVYIVTQMLGEEFNLDGLKNKK